MKLARPGPTVPSRFQITDTRIDIGLMPVKGQVRAAPQCSAASDCNRKQCQASFEHSAQSEAIGRS